MTVQSNNDGVTIRAILIGFAFIPVNDVLIYFFSIK
jgi:hypothetical protein